MASLELRNETYRVVFMYRGRKYAYSLDTGHRDTAEALRGGVEKTLMLINQHVITVPEDADIVAFVKSDGKTAEEPKPMLPAVTFREFQERYLETHRSGVMEANSLSTVTMHLRHFETTLGEPFALQTLTLSDLQRHVAQRAKKKYRGKPLSPVTLRKEVASFRAAWNWAALTGLISGSFPSKGLVYPKTDEKPPFMTRQEIERQLSTDMTENERAELWNCLYLVRTEVDALLQYVKDHAVHGWVYPMFCFAAHTGARRSEMLRVLVSDVDYQGNTVIVREKKRSRKQRTTRRVPLTPHLADVLTEWLTRHPGGQHLFCQTAEVARSKKRSQTTGHRGEKTRASSLKGRQANVTRRAGSAVGPVTKDEAHDHFKRTLAGSKWEVLRGYHVLRHSFISACASTGIDQRLIDEWTGHSTEEQRKRYRHLYPSTQQEAIGRVFG